MKIKNHKQLQELFVKQQDKNTQNISRTGNYISRTGMIFTRSYIEVQLPEIKSV